MMTHKSWRTLAGAVLLVSVWFLLAGCRSYPRFSNETAYEKPRLPEESESPEEVRRPGIEQAQMSRIIDHYLGTPYQKRGATIDGIDCSNLVRNMYYELDGRALAPDVRRQYRSGNPVERGQLEFGDLIFFAFGTRGPSHVGLYIGNGKFVHASEARGVIVSSLDEKEYDSAYIGARRPE